MQCCLALRCMQSMHKQGNTSTRRCKKTLRHIVFYVLDLLKERIFTALDFIELSK
jgi:hypothetical protein